ncbi:MAG: pyruvate formate-lyase [Lachnospiraceae bacterium]|jgi:pyruvate-formate lyase|nr:pyruvate formate-lyase [Lachnospiraceae bacterium]MCI9324985.1 pyruvate formate-lyase [Lachnospiraceae bacterium]
MSQLREFITEKEHHRYRRDYPEYENLADEFKRLKLSPIERMTRRFELMLRLERPVLLPGEQICFLRTVKSLPDCFTKDEWESIRAKHHVHERGYISNLSPNYESAIKTGLLAKRENADEYGRRAIDAILALSDRYREEARRQGRRELESVLARVPRYGAENFREALQFFRILHFGLWMEGNYHNTVGRFDKYMYPYLKNDLERGILTEESAYGLLRDFFISFNKDSDLYSGIQQGDNGQSMVLGGIDEDGKEVFNLLSKMCLRASRELMLIDPKINLRVSRNTPLEIYELGSELTKAGLGFPQYSNDDVVIDGLVKEYGYEPKDAVNYVVAACWEFIIPHVGTDIVNIDALSFPKVIDVCLHRDLGGCSRFEDFMDAVKSEIQAKCDVMCENIKSIWFAPSPFMNLFIEGDLYQGAKYNNFGFHGTGIATAADSLAAIEKYVYEEKSVSKQELIEAVDSNFEEHRELLPILRYEAPKMGMNDNAADAKAVFLLEAFADSLKGKRNCRGGIYRAGTGSAMYYLWHADEIGASPDGRRRREPLGTNFSPSLFAGIKGPLSVIQSFTKPCLGKALNGGPLTLEFASSMFEGEDSIKKVAALVKAYIDMGGHQLQLNAVNTERMKDAQLHPENHRQLIVRIWGWSAYFVELDRDYQDHVIRRQQYSV